MKDIKNEKPRTKIWSTLFAIATALAFTFIILGAIALGAIVTDTYWPEPTLIDKATTMVTTYDSVDDMEKMIPASAKQVNVVFQFWPCEQAGFQFDGDEGACWIFDENGRGLIAMHHGYDTDGVWVCVPEGSFVTCVDHERNQIYPRATVGMCAFTGLTPKCPEPDLLGPAMKMKESPSLSQQLLERAMNEVGYCVHWDERANTENMGYLLEGECDWTCDSATMTYTCDHPHFKPARMRGGVEAIIQSLQSTKLDEVSIQQAGMPDSGYTVIAFLCLVALLVATSKRT